MRAVRVAVSFMPAVILVGQLFAQPDSARRGAAPPRRPAVVLVTSVGPAVGLDWGGYASTRWMADWGILFTTSPHGAFGASYCASMDERGKFEGGPALRYRRWLGPQRALDVAVGWGGEAEGEHSSQFSVLGRVTFMPRPWIGFTVGAGHHRALVGVELGSTPGLVASAIGAMIASLRAVRVGL